MSGNIFAEIIKIEINKNAIRKIEIKNLIGYPPINDNKITEISLKDAKNTNLVKFSKPRFKLLKENNFTIRSNIILLDEPSSSIRLDFKGQFQNNKIIGETEITYMGSDAPGTVILKAITK